MASGGRYRFRYNICNIGIPNRIEFLNWVCFDSKYKRRQKYEYNLKRRVPTAQAFNHSLRRRTPSRMFSGDVAYEIRT